MLKNNTLIFFSIAIVCILGIWIDVMNIDAAQYASISREMLQTNSFLKVFDSGKDYLDKPPFLFWISAISMKIFGINNFGFKFPTFLFATLGVYSTYQFSKLFYNKNIALLSAIVLASCQGFFLMNHDIRTDSILTSMVIFSVWQLTAWIQTDKIKHLIIGCIGISIAMMTKGPIGLLVPIFGIGTHLLINKDIKKVIKWETILGIFVIAICLLPMSYGLFQQFDAHPEKIVNGQTHTSGLRFFYWSQSFGRITGESPWNNGAPFSFLLENMLWSFLPWIVFFLLGFVQQSIILFKNKFIVTSQNEVITLGGFLLTYLSLALSKYQLPHYIFVAFPFAAVITAKFIYELLFEKKHAILYKPLCYFHKFVFILLWVSLIVLLVWPFQNISIIVPCIAMVGFAGFIFLLFFQKKSPSLLLTLSLYTIIGINVFLNGFFYPSLLQYQAGSNIGHFMYTHRIPTQNTYVYKYETFRSLDFYAKGTVIKIDSLPHFSDKKYVILAKNSLPELAATHIPYQVLYECFDYPITLLSIRFLNPQLRPKELETIVLTQLN